MASRQRVIQSAEKLVARGRIQAAIDEYRKVLDRHPNDTSTLNRVGDLYARLNRMPKAIELFQQTAESFARQGFFVKAIAIYKKIIRLDPGQIRAYESLADLYHRQGLTNDSIAQYQVVADYYEKHADTEAAIDVYYNMVTIEPGNPTRRLQLAGMLDRADRKPQALEQYYEIGSLMLEHSRGDDALRVFKEALEVDASNLDFVRKAMGALAGEGFDALSRALLEAAIEKNPQAKALRIEQLDPSPEVAASAPQPSEVASVEEPAAEEPAVDETIDEVAEDEAEPAREPREEAPETVGDEAAEEETPDAAIEEDAEVVASEETSIEEPEDTPAALSEPVETASDDGAADLEFDLSEIADLAGGIDPIVEPATKEETTAPAAEATEEEAGLVLDLDEAEAGGFELEDETEEERSSAAAEDSSPAVEDASREAPLTALELELANELEAVREELRPAAGAETIRGAGDDAAAEQSEAAETVAEKIVSEDIVSEDEEKVRKQLVEAEVLSRYGMDVMAVTVLEKILKDEPAHREALARTVLLQVKLDRMDEALVGANQLADLVAAEGETETWGALCHVLDEKGFRLEEGRFVGEVVEVAEPEPEAEVEPEARAEPEEQPAAREEFSLDQIVEEVEVEARESRKPVQSLDVLAEVIQEIEGESDSKGADEDERWLEELDAEEAAVSDEDATSRVADDERAAEVAPAADSGSAESLAETPASEASPPAEEAAPPAVPQSPSVPTIDLPPGIEAPSPDEGFVDLAGELEQELAREVGELSDELESGMREQSLEDIVEGFRQGMAETLSDEDFDTHFNLGVAYSEMGLTDEAIGEFQMAAKDPRYLVQSCSLLASCFVEKGFNDLAIQSYETGLASPVLEEDERLGLLYELGSLLVATGEPEAAREKFLEIYGTNSNYRDVVARLEELRE